MSRAGDAAYRLRLLILIGGLLYCAAAVFWCVLPYLPRSFYGTFEPYALMQTPLVPWDAGPWQHGIVCLVTLGLILLAQWALLRPVRGWTVRLGTSGRPMRSAVAAAAAMAMLLTVGLIALVLELPNWWVPMMKRGIDAWIGVWAAMIVIWAIWAWVFYRYWRGGDRYTQLQKMIRGLVAGSLLEAFVAVPAQIWATRQRECYCARGSYTTLVFSGLVPLWAFGPGIILLYLREKYRRTRLFPHCPSCGYDLRGSTSSVCSECGAPIAKEA